MLDPQATRTVAVLLGASEFPQSPNLAEGRAFTLSAADVKHYFCAEGGLALPRRNVLSLFDDYRSPSDQLIELTSFLTKRKLELEAAGTPLSQVIVYYVGHGLFTRGDQAYCLAVRCTNELNEGVTSIRAHDLVDAIRGPSAFVRSYWILDCCFAGRILKELQSGVLTAIRVQILGENPTRGAAVLCSSSARETSLAPQGLEHTMFTHALIESLRTGHEAAGPRLSLSELGDLISDNLRRRWPEGWVRPEVHSPDRQEGDIASVPLFPNPGYRQLTTDVAADDVAEKAAAEAARAKAERDRVGAEKAAAESARRKAEIERIAAEKAAAETARAKAEKERIAAEKAAAETARAEAEKDRIAAEKAAAKAARAKAERERVAAEKAAAEAAQAKAERERVAAEKAAAKAARVKAEKERIAAEKAAAEAAHAKAEKKRVAAEKAAAEAAGAKVGDSKPDAAAWELAMGLSFLLFPNVPGFFVGRYLASLALLDPVGRYLHEAKYELPISGVSIMIIGCSVLSGVAIKKILKWMDTYKDGQRAVALLMWPGFLLGFRFFSGIPTADQPSVWFAIEGIAAFLISALVGSE